MHINKGASSRPLSHKMISCLQRQTGNLPFLLTNCVQLKSLDVYTDGYCRGPRAMREELKTLEGQISMFKDSQRPQSLQQAAALLVPTLPFMDICS